MVRIRPAVLMTEIARSDRHQWTRATVWEGRIFFSFPRWSSDVPVSVGELRPSGEVRPFPDARWNDWHAGQPAKDKFVCVQSVYFDDIGNLWILDSGNPFSSGIVDWGPKLIRVRPNETTINKEDIYYFEPPTVRSNSYLNDVRVSTKEEWAFISDSHAGALIALNLGNREKKRLLEGHPSVQAERVVLKIGGREWRTNGQVPQVNVDGIALSPAPDRTHLYYQALTGRTLYRIRTEFLIYPPEDLGKEVETIGKTGAADGIQFGPDERLYLTSIERSAITRLKRRYDPEERETEEDLETVIIDDRLEWPDSIARDDADNSLYVTTSRIHHGSPPSGPFRLFHLQFVKREYAK